MNNPKGFTLIELMIVVFIISILAAVLIPKGNYAETEARLSGLNTNLNTVHGVAQALLPHYSSTEGSALEKAICNRINEQLLTATPDDSHCQDSDVTNPVTGGKGMAHYSDLYENNSFSAAFSYYGNGTEENRWSSSTQEKRLRGCIMVSAYAKDGQLQVKLYPFDNNGYIMEKRIRTVR
jgi:prepilin-type N-terminal cleavage/methylation domain-containing protein